MVLPSHGAFLPNIKNFDYEIRLQFSKLPLVVEQNNYSTKTVYDLDNWLTSPIRNFTLKNCLLGATNIVKNIDIEKHVYSGYETEFDGKDS